MPNFHDYHASVTDELNAVQNKIRNLVKHWATDGEWKEAALRAIVRRHLPQTLFVGRGFVIDRDDSSTQIDVLVLRDEKPTLFRDGDLAIVTPDAPGVIAEIKTSATGPKAWRDIAIKLAKHGERCRRLANNEPWLGIYSFESDDSQVKHVLEAMRAAAKETGVPINCVCLGDDLFVRYWPSGESEPGDSNAEREQRHWRAYRLEHLAPSYFVGNLVDGMCNIDKKGTDYAWFVYQDGKRTRKIRECNAEDCLPPKKT
jgi:hypothetical protein